MDIRVLLFALAFDLGLVEHNDDEDRAAAVASCHFLPGLSRILRYIPDLDTFGYLFGALDFKHPWTGEQVRTRSMPYKVLDKLVSLVKAVSDQQSQ